MQEAAVSTTRSPDEAFSYVADVTRYAGWSPKRGQTFENTFVEEPEGSGSPISRAIDLPVPGGSVGAIFPLLFATVIKSGVQKGINLLGSKLDAGA